MRLGMLYLGKKNCENAGGEGVGGGEAVGDFANILQSCLKTLLEKVNWNWSRGLEGPKAKLSS